MKTIWQSASRSAAMLALAGAVAAAQTDDWRRLWIPTGAAGCRLTTRVPALRREPL